MKKKIIIISIILLLAIIIVLININLRKKKVKMNDKFNKHSTVKEIINYKNFKDYGRLIFPTNLNIPGNTTLNNLNDYYPWYDLNVKDNVDVVNYFKEEADNGNTIFYDIYTDEEKKSAPSKKNTGLFFFKGKKNSKFALISAGGGFVYVGAMKDSFPHALELSKKGYNAFALIYRPNSEDACIDLSRAISFIFEHKYELGVDTNNYSLWGGSAGARMTDWVGTYGTSYFGEKEYPKPSAIVMQYTGLSEVTGAEPPTYANVGDSDYIANYKIMERRINEIKENGTNAEIEVFKGLSHGFGTGRDTVAEGWINNAIKFWEDNSK